MSKRSVMQMSKKSPNFKLSERRLLESVLSNEFLIKVLRASPKAAAVHNELLP